MTIDTATAKASAWQQGWSDYLAAVSADTHAKNPYDLNTQHHIDWWCGYSHAEQTFAETQYLEPSHVA